MFYQDFIIKTITCVGPLDSPWHDRPVYGNAAYYREWGFITITCTASTPCRPAEVRRCGRGEGEGGWDETSLEPQTPNNRPRWAGQRRSFSTCLFSPSACLFLLLPSLPRRVVKASVVSLGVFHPNGANQAVEQQASGHAVRRSPGIGGSPSRKSLIGFFSSFASSSSSFSCSFWLYCVLDRWHIFLIS